MKSVEVAEKKEQEQQTCSVLKPVKLHILAFFDVSHDSLHKNSTNSKVLSAIGRKVL